MQFKVERQAKKDLEFFKKNNIKLYEKIFILMQDILKNPETWLWKPEHLKYFNENVWSRRINQEHRIIYMINYSNNEIKFLSFRFHYK